MSTLQKAIVGLLGIGLATTLLLPDRKTVPVIGALTQLGQKWLGTAMGLVKNP